MLNFSYVTPKRHILAQNRVFWHILRQNSLRRLGCTWFPEPPKNSQVNNLVCEVAHARKQNPLSDLDQILQGDRYPRRNHLCKFWWRSVEAFRGGGGQSLPFSNDFDRRPYNTLALPCEWVIWCRLNLWVGAICLAVDYFWRIKIQL